MPPLEDVTSESGDSEEEEVTSQRARRTGKAQGKREVIWEELQLTLRDLEMKHGNFLVSQELDTIASEWGVPHNHHNCKHCFQHPSGKWDFCHLSNYSPYVPFHECPLFQPCDC
jgi:hypothetical protein